MQKGNSGFTLIEISIVLVIIGLLLGGVLKGQEMVTQAKIKNISNDFSGIAVALASYQDRYKRLPGDDPGASRWAFGGTALSGGDGSNSIAGTYASTTLTEESRTFWAHLRLSGFLTGPTDSLTNALTLPANAVGGISGVQNGGLGMSGLLICSGGLPTKIAQAVDSQFDDGNAMTGSVRAMLEGTPPTALSGTAPGANYVENGSNLYVVCRSY